MSRRDHLTLEVLLELEDGGLAPAEAAAAREHLRGCAECRELSRGLTELPEPPDAATIGAGPAEKALAWRELQTALAAGETAPSDPRPPAPRQPPTLRRSPAGWRPLAAAAALFVAAGSGYWLADSDPALTAAASTQLLPVDLALLGRSPEPERASCPPPQGAFVFVLGGLEHGAATERPSRQVELAGPGGSFATAASINDHGEIELILERSLLIDGEYRIRVRNWLGDEDPIKEYRLILDCP